MKQILFSVAGVFAAFLSTAQITITAADMPVVNDTLRWSASVAVGANLNLGNTGANQTWDYSTLTPMAQGLDKYQLAATINLAYAAIISPTAYGYKVADSIPGLGSALPISINNIYSFYNKKSNPSRFVAEGFAASVVSIPTPAAYSDEDELYYLPLTFGQRDSSTFRLSVSMATLGSYSQKGHRITEVDGWGTIITPFYTSATPALRVRSELMEIDTISFATQKFGIPRNTVEYKWLVNGDHYPALIITTNKTAAGETPTSVRYRDSYRALGVRNIINGQSVSMVAVYPNPATNNVTIDLPNTLYHYAIELFDVTGRLVQHTQNKSSINVSTLPKGQYLIRASGERFTGYGRFVK